MRIKRSVNAVKKRRKVLKSAKGYWGSRSKLYRIAKHAVMKAGQYAYIGRRLKKRDFRQLWIARINAGFPHFVKNCSLNAYNYIVTNGIVRSTLIISPPGAGKTTYLRDLVYQMSNKLDMVNILVIDERKEIAGIYNGENVQKLENIDVVVGSTKKFGFVNGIRSMKPDVIVTDEINIDKDLDSIENALTSGVKVIATVHASSVDDLRNKNSFKTLLNKGLFERFVVLGTSNGVGTLEGIFNENLVCIGV